MYPEVHLGSFVLDMGVGIIFLLVEELVDAEFDVLPGADGY